MSFKWTSLRKKDQEKSRMLRSIVTLASLAVITVHCAPQLNDAELKEQSFNRINEAEYDYK